MGSSLIGPIFIRIFIFLLGLMMVLTAINKLSIYFQHRYLGRMTYGIIDHPSSSRDFGGRPLIRYESALGEVYEFKSRAKTHWFITPKKGERVKIFFNEKKPQNAIVDNLFYYCFIPLIFLAAGGYCCIYAIFYHKEY